MTRKPASPIPALAVAPWAPFAPSARSAPFARAASAASAASTARAARAARAAHGAHAARFAVLVILALGLAVSGCAPHAGDAAGTHGASAGGADAGHATSAAEADPGHATSATRASPPPRAVAHADIGFRGTGALADHFAKHGQEFGAATAADYLALAQALRDAPAGGEVVEARRADGVTCRFDRRSGAFLAFNSDLTLRTFFKPHDGEDYFRRQLEREH